MGNGEQKSKGGGNKFVWKIGVTYQNTCRYIPHDCSNSTRHSANMQSHNKHFSLELKDNKQDKSKVGYLINRK
jgi:hypothetical protein